MQPAAFLTARLQACYLGVLYVLVVISESCMSGRCIVARKPAFGQQPPNESRARFAGTPARNALFPKPRHHDLFLSAKASVQSAQSLGSMARS